MNVALGTVYKPTQLVFYLFTVISYQDLAHAVECDLTQQWYEQMQISRRLVNIS